MTRNVPSTQDEIRGWSPSRSDHSEVRECCHVSMPPPNRDRRDHAAGSAASRTGASPGSCWRDHLSRSCHLPGLAAAARPTEKLTYNQVIAAAEAGNVTEAKVNNDTGKITGTIKPRASDEKKFSVSGPRPIPDEVEKTLREQRHKLEFANETRNVWLSLLPTVLVLRAAHRLLRLDEPPGRRAR